MAQFELPSLEPLANTLPKLLRPKVGRFIAINLHPAFSKPATHRVIEVLENPTTGLLETHHSMKSSAYMSIDPCSSQGIRGQPTPQTLFHRPLHELLSLFLESGEMMLDRFKELAFKDEPESELAQSWHNLSQFPMLVAFRLRAMCEKPL